MSSEQLTLFAEAFHASPTASQESAGRARTNATCGESTPELLAQLSPDGCWLRMSQGCYQARLDGSLDEFSGTWPRSGMTRNGRAYELPTLAHITRESASFLWPTPRANIAMSATVTLESAWDAKRFPNLETVAGRHTWATPQARDYRTGQAARWDNPNRSRNLNDQAGGKLSVMFVEWLMGFPSGWTDLER